MLMPRRVSTASSTTPTAGTAAKGGTKLAFGEFGIQAIEGSYVTNRQIESARIAMTRHIKRGGKVWINIYPDRPLAEEVRRDPHGLRQGLPEWWIARRQARARALRALRSDRGRRQGSDAPRAHKLPLKTRFITREAGEF